MAFKFKKATKEQAKARIAIDGFAGSGKTYTSLAIGTTLVEGGRVALIDTEYGSASKYAHKFDFDTLGLDSFSPDTYVAAIKAAEAEGYDVIIIDSLSHAWAGKDGALEQAGGNFNNWKNVTPKHNRLVESMVASTSHIIATLRTKVEYLVEKDERGKTSVSKVGTKAIQREGVEYEFDVVGDMDQSHTLHITKTRCEALDERTFHKPGANVSEILRAWLTDGVMPKTEEERFREELSSNVDVAALLTMAKEATTADDVAVLLKAARDANLQGAARKTVLDAYQAAKARVEASEAAA